MLILLPPSEKKALQAGPAITVYTGVLYSALSWATLTRAQQTLGQRSIAIISARYGALKPLDHIEPYREKIKNTAMRAPITKALDGLETDLIIDCRPSTYQGVWTAPVDICVMIKVFTKVGGVKKTITHMSKKIRGEVARLVLQTKKVPTSPQELCAIISGAYECELVPTLGKQPWVLEVYC